LFSFGEIISFISFVRPKEMNQSKGRRKCQLQPFCPPATPSHVGATKKPEVRTISGFPSLRHYPVPY